MHVLVTGGCGFIGSHFVRVFLENNPQSRVTNLDALTYAAHPDTGAYLEKTFSDRYSFVKGDIGAEDLDVVLRHGEVPIDAIVNFAAESHVDRSILDPMTFVRTNVMGVQNLLLQARKMGNVRFVHVSTDEVYGTLEPSDEPFTEQSDLEPNSPYAASKASADLLVLASHRTYGQEVLITRASNNYGSYQFPEKLLPVVIANAMDGLPIPVYGDGRQVRDWLYVEDHCRAIELALKKGRAGEVYNISGHEERANIDLIHEVLGILGKPTSLITHVGDRPGHDRRYALDSTKIRLELGWLPQVGFRDGLERTARWYSENQDWWRKVRDQEYFEYYRANYATKFGEGTLQ